jgi:phosphoribosylformylglycinamidine cyclo-ligase
MALTYKDAGVDIDAGDAFVEKIKARVAQTCGPRVVSGVGGFACLYDVDGDRMLAAGTDGVGTKLLVAQKLGIHHTIGIDLVAMCINDILCTGAKGLFFMDYLATGKLNVEVSDQIVAGIVEGCMQSKVALIGGETAEMPGMYAPGKYDLAGFAVGEVFRNQVLDGTQIQDGDSIVGIASSGIHSNGLSLARALGKEEGDDSYWRTLLEPTRIYTPQVESLRDAGVGIHGIAHITGGGLLNIARLNVSKDYHITNFPNSSEVSSIFTELSERSQLSPAELYKTFNMGVGLCVITSEPDRTREIIASSGINSWVIGHVSEGSGSVHIGTERLS